MAIQKDSGNLSFHDSAMIQMIAEQQWQLTRSSSLGRSVQSRNQQTVAVQANDLDQAVELFGQVLQTRCRQFGGQYSAAAMKFAVRICP